MTSLQRGLWVLVGACVAHVGEEYVLHWQSWVEAVSGHPVSGGMFVGLNTGFILLACLAATIGFRHPVIALALPSLTLINGVIFHIAPTILFGRISPGVFSAVVLYLPISTWLFWQAKREGHLTASVALMAVVLGAAVMAVPLVVLRLA